MWCVLMKLARSSWLTRKRRPKRWTRILPSLIRRLIVLVSTFRCSATSAMVRRGESLAGMVVMGQLLTKDLRSSDGLAELHQRPTGGRASGPAPGARRGSRDLKSADHVGMPSLQRGRSWTSATLRASAESWFACSSRPLHRDDHGDPPNFFSYEPQTMREALKIQLF